MKKKRIIALALLLIWIMSSAVAAIEPMDVNSKASILVDASDGHDIYSENADEKMFPASLTKLMTALLVAENVPDLSVIVTANESAFEGLSDAGSSVGMKPGEQMTVDNLLICLLVASANETANILAEYVSGSVPAFVELMNSRAAELGLTGTHFANPHGLHNEEHYTTARDMAKIAIEVRKHERLREICQMKDARIPATNLKDERYFFTTNSLISRYKELGYVYSHANGMKTGSTSQAGLCLVSSAEYKGTELISVVLGAEKDEEGKKGHFVESKRLLVWGFENFSTATLIASSDIVCEVKVKSAKDRDYVTGHVPENFSLMMPNDFDKSKVEYIVDSKKEIEAPIKKDDEIGTVVIRYEGRDYITLPVVASYDVEISYFEYVKNAVVDFFGSTTSVILLIIVLMMLVVIYVLHIRRRNRRRRRRERTRKRYYR